jgi:hypothetical protein
MTIDIRPMIEDISQVMTRHITHILNGVIGEYTLYKETHDTVMGLPCVRKLQDRIAELEKGCPVSAPTNNAAADAANSRENEIAQLQAAIAEMNRYIIALESKVGGSGGEKDEESLKLEIHEDDNIVVGECSTDDSFSMSSTQKNVIITSSSSSADDVALEVVEEEEEENEDAEEDAEEDTEEEEETVEDTAAEEEEEAVEEEEVEADAEEEEAEEEEAEAAEEEEEEEEEAEEATAEAAEEEEEAVEEEEVAAEEEEEAAEEDAAEATEEEEAAEEEAAAEEAAAEEAEIEVSEVKIKGKTYFTTDPQNGIIYACVDDDVGDEVGVFKNGVAVFNKGKK